MHKSQGMITVGAVTYRIVRRGDVHDVVRIADDARVGSFRSQPRLFVVTSQIGAEAVLAVASEALHRGRLPWACGTGRESPRKAWWQDLLASCDRVIGHTLSFFFSDRPAPTTELVASRVSSRR